MYRKYQMAIKRLNIIIALQNVKCDVKHETKKIEESMPKILLQLLDILHIYWVFMW